MDLLLQHMALECIGLDEHGDLIRIPGIDPDTIHRVYAARLRNRDSIFFRADVPLETRKQLLRLPFAAFFDQPAQVEAILARDAPVEEIHIGKSYHFVSPPEADLPRPVIRLPGERTVFAILVDGAAVSTCESSRENTQAGEAWVQTVELYRRRGYARQVTAAWGAALLAQDKTPFYSHRWENLASQAVAHSLQLEEYLQDAGYA